MVVVVNTDVLAPPLWGSWMMMVGRARRAAAGRHSRPPREEKGALLLLPLRLPCPAIFCPIMAGPFCVLGGQRQAPFAKLKGGVLLLLLPPSWSPWLLVDSGQ